MELLYAADHDNPMQLPEIEAAQALAVLATCSAARGGGGGAAAAASCSEEPTRSSSEDEAVADFHENKYRMATSSLISGVADRDEQSKQCSKSNRWNSSTKLRENLIEADKEARRVRRILANRESARQTICRRQAMHMELMRKAVDLSEENENLKKEKELAVEAYNSLKSRNKFLNLQVANAKKAESIDKKEEPKSSEAEKHTSASTSSPLSLYHQPFVIPIIWPSVPTSNYIRFQYPSPSDVMSLSESSLERREISSSHSGSEISLGKTRPGNSCFMCPLPWILPFPSYGPILPSSCSDTEKRTNGAFSTHMCRISLSSDNLFVAENNELSPKPNMLMKASSCTKSTPVGSGTGARLTFPVSNGDHYPGLQPEVALITPENLSCIRSSSEDDTSYPYAASAMDNVFENFPKNNAGPFICCQNKPENMFSAIKARRRRKELMMLRNVKYRQTCAHRANS